MRQLNIIRFKFLFLSLAFLLSAFFSDKAVASGGVLTPDTISKDDIEIVFPSVLMTDLKSEVLININDVKTLSIWMPSTSAQGWAVQV